MREGGRRERGGRRDEGGRGGYVWEKLGAAGLQGSRSSHVLQLSEILHKISNFLYYRQIKHFINNCGGWDCNI